jgi:hypothetical protein
MTTSPIYSRSSTTDGASVTNAGSDTSSRRSLLGLVNVAGGLAVLGSYAHGLLTHPGNRGAAWGGLPDELRGLYTISMFVAAAGYLVMTHYAWAWLAPRQATVWGLPATRILTPLYFAVLVSSALWLPLTFRLIESSSAVDWLLMRLVLGTVAVSSIALVCVISAARPAPNGGRRPLAIAGGLAFCWQTAVLDAMVWTHYYPI